MSIDYKADCNERYIDSLYFGVFVKRGGIVCKIRPFFISGNHAIEIQLCYTGIRRKAEINKTAYYGKKPK